MYYEVCGLDPTTGVYHISCAIDDLYIAEDTARRWAEGEDDEVCLTEIVINIWRVA
jgi:hypothetical protein